MNDEREFPMETGLNILVVDDDPDIRFATVRLLGKAGYLKVNGCGKRKVSNSTA